MSTSNYWLLLERVPQADGTSKHFVQFGDISKSVVLREKQDLYNLGFFGRESLIVRSVQFDSKDDPLHIDIKSFIDKLDKGEIA